MTDVNLLVKDILSGVEGAKVVHFYPDSFNVLPVICYYELVSNAGMYFDNEEQSQNSYVQIDIYTAKPPVNTSTLAIEVDRRMRESGFIREHSQDLKPEDGICHKTMRYAKQIYY